MCASSSDLLGSETLGSVARGGEAQAERLLAELNEHVANGIDWPKLREAYFGPRGRIAEVFGENIGESALFSPPFSQRLRQVSLRAEFNTPWKAKSVRLLVRHAACLSVTSFSPDTDIHVAREQLLSQRISGAPVLASDGRLVGILSERDMLSIYRRDSGSVRVVSDVMTCDALLTVQLDELLTVAAQIFSNQPFRRLPVLEEGRVVGLLARRDVLRLIESIRVTPEGELTTEVAESHRV
jgi:signal-transduction protein with cAMP-binding, CBS, and nucleotidyltransferase domain